MAFSLSFSPEFYGDVYDPGDVVEKPTTVAQALCSMSDAEWNEMARDVFDVPEGDYLDIGTVMAKILETDTCGTLTSPVDVWIDPDGYYTVDVYDSV